MTHVPETGIRKTETIYGASFCSKVYLLTQQLVSDLHPFTKQESHNSIEKPPLEVGKGGFTVYNYNILAIRKLKCCSHLYYGIYYNSLLSLAKTDTVQNNT